jgi:sugar (pentulose or hexulose) kinase
VPDVAFITTLSGYVHWMLTGEACIGIGDASGMFPINGNGYDRDMLARFDRMAAEKGISLRLESMLPRVLCAGEDAGCLSEEGARLIDASGWIRSGTPFCPPEGDAGTGMVATNSVTPLTGNVSAGTSIFAMIVLEKPLQNVYTEIDMVTTPSGSPVAMVHCNNCTSDLDAWVGLFGEAISAAGASVSKSKLYDMLYWSALTAEPDAGGLLHYSYYGGEQITNISTGTPMFLRKADSRLTLSNMFRSLLFSSIATLKLGMAILGNEKVEISLLRGHGGLFKTRGVAQRIMASALDLPIGVSETAGEGGSWGIAVLAGYQVWREAGETLERYLESRVFSDEKGVTEMPDAEITAGFADYMEIYAAGLPLERAAADALRHPGRD